MHASTNFAVQMVAASALGNMLALASANLVKLQQEHPFGDILIVLPEPLSA
jgi:chromatin segregation and condensation protein Rec8/ScpA/Scc1 (kleisin family)